MSAPAGSSLAALPRPTPRVSIVMAAYNPGPYLEPTVASVIGQTLSDWELIIVDDGSAQDITAVARLDPRIIYLRQANAGQSVARNVGLLRAKAELIAFLDQDDLWHPDKLAQQVAAMEADSDCGMSYTNFDRIDADGRWLGPGFDGGAVTYADLLLGCCVCLSTTMIRRDALAASGMFDPRFVGLQDFDMWLKIARRHPVRYLPAVLGSYRQHDGNLSHRYAMLFAEIRDVYREHAALATRAGDRATLRRVRQGMRRARFIYGSQAFDRSRTAWRRREVREFVSHMSKALRLVPGFVARSCCTHLTRTLHVGGGHPTPTPATHA